MKNNQLTIENILEEDDIIQDLKFNTNSEFISMLSNEAIRKLIDYATKMPTSDDQKIGYKYPFNATEILCADNSVIQGRIMNEIVFIESEFYENKENVNEEKQKFGENEGETKINEKNVKEENKDKDNSEKKQDIGFVLGLSNALNKFKEEQKKENKEKEKHEKSQSTETPKKTEEDKNEDKNKETKTEETKPENKEQVNSDEKKEESKSKDKKEETKIEETKSENKEQVKPEEKKEESKPEDKTPQIANDDTKTGENKQEPKSEDKNDETAPKDKKEELKPEEKKDEPKPEEQNQEVANVEKLEDNQEKEGETKTEKKNEGIKSEEKKEEKHEVKNIEGNKPKENEEEKKLDEAKTEEIKSGIQEKSIDEEKKEEKEKENNEEKGQNKQSLKEEDKEEKQKKKEEIEDNEKEVEDEDNVKKVITYDNIDYLFSFLKESKETISNHVLVGYFYKILNHLISSESSSTKIVQYIFDYPYKNKFDILDALVNNLNRKSIGAIVTKLLLYIEEIDELNLNEKKAFLIQKMLEELEKTEEKDKYECICDVLASTLNNKSFYALFMNNTSLVELLFSLLEKSVGNPKKLIYIIYLLIKVNENILKNLSIHVTKDLTPENPNMFNYESSFPSEEKQVSNEEMNIINKKVILLLINSLKKNGFNFLDDLGEYTKDNEEFMTTYQQKQKKLGMKKLSQIEFIRTFLDIFVNSYSAEIHMKEIEELIEIIKTKNIFYNCHKLFFDFPFSNIYQIYYSQIIDIIINDATPKSLIECFFKYLNEKKEEKNLVTELIEHFFSNIKFVFTSNNISFAPNLFFEMDLLNKISTTKNENVKKLLGNDNNLTVFNEILGEEINNIFNQKLLYSNSHEDNFGGSEDEKILLTFGSKNLMEIINEDIDIYNLFKKGEDYKTKLNEKHEREKAEREKMKQEIVRDDEENKDEQINPDDEEGIEEVGVEKNEGNEEKGEENNENKIDNKEGEVEVKDNEEKEKQESESIEEKKYNDVNFWVTHIKPNDDIMSAILNDIE